MNETPPTIAGSEEAALQALDAGDHRTTLDVLMQAHGTAVYGYCRMMLADAERAKDVLQKTFVQAYEGLPRFERRCSLRTWVFAIARHRCLDELKVWRRWTLRATPIESETEDGSVSIATHARSPEHDVLDDEWRRILADCLGALAPRVRDAVVRRYIEGLPYLEISEISGEPPTRLRVRVTRALPVLRRCVEAAGVRR